MGTALFLLVLGALIANVLCVEYVKVILGDSFTLPVNCKSDEVGTLRKHETRQVAAHRSGVWIPEESFKARMDQSSSLVFNRAVYTDSGVYVLKCGGREVDIQVEVVLSFDATVKEGEAVSLPCHYSTTAGTCWSVRWAKGREDVLLRSSCDDKRNWTADDRLSLSANWRSDGDLSLNLQQARKDDEGDYFCYVQREDRGETNGIPAAARLKVSGRSPDQITSTSPPPPQPSPAPPPQEPCEAAVGITAVVCLIIGAVFGWLFKSCCSRCASRRAFQEGRGHDHVNGVFPEHTNGFPVTVKLTPPSEDF